MPTLLHISIAASPLIILLALTRPLLKTKVPPRVFLALWLLVMSRLLIPVWIPVTGNSMKPLLNPIYGGVFNFTQLAVAAAPSRSLLVAVWSTAALALLGRMLVRHLHCRKIWRTALPLERSAVTEWVEKHAGYRRVRVLVIERTNDVISYGVVRPVIVFSREIVEDHSDYILTQMAAHELGHIRGYHTLLQYAVLAVGCVHWFNPVVWLLIVLFQRDMELAADASAKRFLGSEGAKGYAAMLLSLSEQAPKNQFAKSLLAPSLAERIHVYVKSKKTNLKLAIGITIMIIALLGVLSAVPENAMRVDNRHTHYKEEIDHYFERLENDGYELFEEAPNV